MAARLPPGELLTAGLRELDLPKDLHRPLMHYLDKLLVWNQVGNIIGDRDPERLVWRHLLESLCAHRYVNGRCLDLGTGAGLPGLPLALARPDTSWVLLDGRLKCCRFLRHIVGDLALSNVTVCHMRAEQYRPEAKFDTIICRALATLPAYYRLAEPLRAPTGRLFALKGPAGADVSDEINGLQTSGAWGRCYDMDVPGGRRCCLVEMGSVDSMR